jgi:hypothetical protein
VTVEGDGAGTVQADVFGWVPEWVLDSGVSDRAIRVYAILTRYGNDTGRRMPGRKTLAKRCGGCSVDSIDRAVRELKVIRALKVEGWDDPEGDRGTNLYILLPHPDLVAKAQEGGSRTTAATPPQDSGHLAAPVRPNRKRRVTTSLPPSPSLPVRDPQGSSNSDIQTRRGRAKAPGPSRPPRRPRPPSDPRVQAKVEEIRTAQGPQAARAYLAEVGRNWSQVDHQQRQEAAIRGLEALMTPAEREQIGRNP